MIEKIRQFLSAHHLDALLIARTDSFLGEYFPPEAGTLKQATHFSGSAGIALITKDEAILFVDSRYTEQAKIETNFTVLEVPTETIPSQWMEEHLSNKVIGYNPWQRSVLWLKYMEEKPFKLFEVSWQDWLTLLPQPAYRPQPDFDYPIEYCGEKTEDKIRKITLVLKQQNLDAFVLTTPDSVSYILNKRSLQVPEYPVVFQRLIVWSNGLYMELPKDLTLLAGKTIAMDMAATPVGLFRRLQPIAKIVNLSDPVAEMKAIKNSVEQNNIRQACLFESRVICRFLAWVEKNKATIDEISCEQKLKELRSESPLYRGDSFETIAAVGEHAARAHYHADEESNTRVINAPMLLVDTGGNYLNGTTDMTRTICIGQPTDIMKKRYTQVLKGHIALATAVVKKGDLPAELDKKARSFLRADNVDYGHSTGHGIGMYLAVHEAPPSIAGQANTPLSSGMLFSNEPAFYDPMVGYGIRLENMILTLDGPDDALILENLLWIPFDGRLIDFTLLTEAEKEWLTAYHKAISDRIFPTLTPEEQSVLKPLLDFFL